MYRGYPWSAIYRTFEIPQGAGGYLHHYSIISNREGSERDCGKLNYLQNSNIHIILE